MLRSWEEVQWFAMFLSFSILQLLALVFKQKDALEDECEAGQNTECYDTASSMRCVSVMFFSRFQKSAYQPVYRFQSAEREEAWLVFLESLSPRWDASVPSWNLIMLC